MTILLLALFFVFIIFLIATMFLLLKRLVTKINQQAIDYFVDKLKAYDNLLDKKEYQLKDLNKLIDNKEEELDKREVVSGSNTEVFLYDMKSIDYKDNDIFKKMKAVDEKFNFDNKKIIEEFLQNKFDDKSVLSYNKYCKVKDIFTQDVVFKLMTMRDKTRLEKVKELLGDSGEVLDDFMKRNKNFDLKKFISYFNKVIRELDPYVYVYVGNDSENYNTLNKYIKTLKDDSIFKGLKIMYRGKMYDYSL